MAEKRILPYMVKDENKLKILRGRGHPGLSGWSLNGIRIQSYKRDTGSFDRDAKRGEDEVNMEPIEMRAQAKE